MTFTQLVGMWLLIASGTSLGVIGLVWLATRSERRAEPRLPRVIVRAVDYIDSYHETEVQR